MAALYAAVDMNTLPFMHGRPYPKPSGQLSIADMVKVLLAHGADVEPEAEDAAPAPPQQHQHPESRRGHDAAAARRRVRRRRRDAPAADGRAPIPSAKPEERQHDADARVRLRPAWRSQRRCAQEFEKGTPEELLAAVKVCVEELELDPNAVNDQGDTALHVAHSGDIVRYLAEHGAKRRRPRTSAGRRRSPSPSSRIDRSNRQLRPDVVAVLKTLDNGATPPAEAPKPFNGPAARQSTVQ